MLLAQSGKSPWHDRLGRALLESAINLMASPCCDSYSWPNRILSVALCLCV